MQKKISYSLVASFLFSRKILSVNCMIHAIMSNTMPKIARLLLSKVLKPIKLYSTNNI